MRRSQFVSLHTAGLSNRPCFTLNELLVVIVIISILASLLMPALQNAVSSAKTMACLNNMKQLGVGVALYADNYNGWLPTSCATVDTVHSYWRLLLAPFVGVKATSVFSNTLGEGVFCCPSFEVPEIITQKWKEGGYGWNWVYLGASPYDPDPARRNRRLNTIEKKSQTIVIGDTRDNGTHDYDFMKFNPPSFGAGYIGDRHNGGICLLWADFHNTWELKDELLINGDYFWKLNK